MRRVYLLYALSGFLSLGYQVGWFRVFVDRFGSTNLTFAFVLANFIGGLGAGSLASRPIAAWTARRIGTRDPLRLYGVVELAVTAAAALTLLLPLLPADAWGSFPYEIVDGVHEPAARLRWAQFAISTACVFAPCFFMGVTFPLLCNAFRRDGRFPAALYAWNTLGACAGLLACEFVLLAMLGHERMYVGLVAGNAALGAYFLFAGSKQGETSEVAASDGTSSPRTFAPVSLFAAAIVSGGLTGAFEADALRRLQFLDCRTGAALSCISFWAILAIFVASTLVRLSPRVTMRTIRIAYTAAFAWYVAVWSFAYPLRDWINHADNLRVRAALPQLPPGLVGSFQFFHFGYGVGPLLAFTGLVVFPPLLGVALLLPYVCNSEQAEGRHLGPVYGVNTLAFCAGLVAFTALVPRVNVFYAMRLFFGVFAVGAALTWFLRPDGRRVAQAAAGAGAVLVALALATPSSFAASWFEPGSPAATLPVRAIRSNGAHTTFVVADPAGDALYFDSHSMSGCNPPAQQYMRLMAHFPLLAAQDPKSALLICFGVGSTASAIAAHDSIEALDVVDLNEQVFATAPEFAASNGAVIEDPRVRLIHDDGRRYLALTDRRYDLITSEPPPPMAPGVSRLYSVEYYESARACLAPGGLMTQWLPIDQMPLPAMRAALSSFVQVFPESVCFVGYDTNYILMGCNGELDLAVVERRFSTSPRAVADLARFAIREPLHLFARITKCGPTLIREFGDAPVVSDLRNDFSRVFHDPSAPPVLTYDPRALLAEIGRDSLECSARLEELVLHLGRLKSTVADFPELALMSVRTRADAPVALAGVDWFTLGRRMEAVDQALLERNAERAFEQLQQTYAAAPEYSTAARNLAALLVQRQQWSEALEAFGSLQKSDPRDPAGFYGAAFALFQLGRADDSLALLSEQLGRFPEMPALHRLRGDVLASRERWSEALDSYERVLQLAPQDAPAKAGRARCVEALAR